MLVLPEAITQANTVACLAALTKELAQEGASDVVVDAARLTRFDSAALALLLELRRQALKMGKTFALRDVSQRLQDLADLYGIAELLPSKA
ncbi:lipid asymmetry maintenance protein MlaB [Rhodoferax sp.]|uniref:STAS domain-containing protein n=1 Tax=Rhodoferax sp. TaxID=50421 RepID=UPI00271FF84B|nr:STAS domain-containing protein [Rhodoferax sp.]MDO9144970.1 STAS domain-containing protein [Rhodoferax sp.]MDP3863147.1 STAS domain-containing protein [Rhodoferax sp.]